MKIELTEKHIEVLIKSLDLYSRVLMGQIEELNSVLLWNDVYKQEVFEDEFKEALGCGDDDEGCPTKEDRFKIEMDRRDSVLNILNIAKEAMGIPRNAHFGIGNTCEQGQLAYEIRKTIEQFHSWKKHGKNPLTDQRDWNTMLGVNYDGPLKLTDEPLPKVET